MARTARVKDRRRLRFGRLTDILADVEALGRASSIRAAGNWTPAQVVDHVAEFIRQSLDGFPPGAKAPLFIRVVAVWMRDGLLNRPMRAGFKIPRTLRSVQPPPEVSWDDAAAKLRRVVQRIENGEKMRHRSPLLGPLVHEQWIQLHCRHAEMHLSFLHPVHAPTEASADSPSASDDTPVAVSS